MLLVMSSHKRLRMVFLKRNEAVDLLKELVVEHLIQLSLVLIEQKSPDKYQLQIKGKYNLQLVKLFVKDKFFLEECRGYLIFNN